MSTTWSDHTDVIYPNLPPQDCPTSRREPQEDPRDQSLGPQLSASGSHKQHHFEQWAFFLLTIYSFDKQQFWSVVFTQYQIRYTYFTKLLSLCLHPFSLSCSVLAPLSTESATANICTTAESVYKYEDYGAGYIQTGPCSIVHWLFGSWNTLIETLAFWSKSLLNGKRLPFFLEIADDLPLGLF